MSNIKIAKGATVTAYKKMIPDVDKALWIADGARVIGDVRLGKDVSLWYNVVLRGDVNHIEIGDFCNIQDSSCCHVENGLYPLILKEGVTVGHSVTLHGCTIGHHCLIGMGATILNNCTIGEESIIAAGTLIPEGTNIPPRSLVMGVPGKVRRELGEEDVKKLHHYAEKYVRYARTYVEDEDIL
jgi:carbonic anhydrase/acetyltransferase-like protein (isoleucine patch superfamily)